MQIYISAVSTQGTRTQGFGNLNTVVVSALTRLLCGGWLESLTYNVVNDMPL